jgi:hypothetical protein
MRWMTTVSTNKLQLFVKLNWRNVDQCVWRPECYRLVAFKKVSNSKCRHHLLLTFWLFLRHKQLLKGSSRNAWWFDQRKKKPKEKTLERSVVMKVNKKRLSTFSPIQWWQQNLNVLKLNIVAPNYLQNRILETNTNFRLLAGDGSGPSGIVWVCVYYKVFNSYYFVYVNE